MVRATYDANGNMTSDGLNTYGWTRNQLASIAANRRPDTTPLVAEQQDHQRLSVSFRMMGKTRAGAGRVRAVVANLLSGLYVDPFQSLRRVGRGDSPDRRAGSTVVPRTEWRAFNVVHVRPPGNAPASGQVSTNAFQFTGVKTMRPGCTTIAPDITAVDRAVSPGSVVILNDLKSIELAGRSRFLHLCSHEFRPLIDPDGTSATSGIVIPRCLFLTGSFARLRSRTTVQLGGDTANDKRCEKLLLGA